jgi:hypothetical protein
VNAAIGSQMRTLWIDVVPISLSSPPVAQYTGACPRTPLHSEQWCDGRVFSSNQITNFPARHGSLCQQAVFLFLRQPFQEPLHSMLCCRFISTIRNENHLDFLNVVCHVNAEWRSYRGYLGNR